MHLAYLQHPSASGKQEETCLLLRNCRKSLHSTNALLMSCLQKMPMARQKDKPLDDQQMAAMEKAGKDGRYYVLIRELPKSLIVKDIRTNHVEMVSK